MSCGSGKGKAMLNGRIARSVGWLACLGVVCGATWVLAGQNQSLQIAVTDNAGNLLPDASAFWIDQDGEAVEAGSVGYGVFVVKDLKDSKGTVDVRHDDWGSATIPVALPDDREVAIVVALDGVAGTARVIDAAEFAHFAPSSKALPGHQAGGPSATGAPVMRGTAAPAPRAGDSCTDAEPVTVNSSTAWVSHGGWFEFTATSAQTGIEGCGSSFDTIIEVYAADCTTLLQSNDDCGAGSYGAGSNPNASCYDGATGLERDSCLCLSSAPGTLYKVRVFAYPTDPPPAGSTIQLTITDNCDAPPPPMGACCVDLDCAATNTFADCQLLGGVWYSGEDCATFTCPSDPCANPLYSNGSWDPANALSAERRTDGSMNRWIVDDVTLTDYITVNDLHWWSNEPITFNWNGTVDYIILRADGPSGTPGSTLAQGLGVVATHVDTGNVAFGDPVWFNSIDGLSIDLDPGTYWFGLRLVQQSPFSGQGWWMVAPANGTSEVYHNYGPNAPAWDPGSLTFEGVQYQVAFCVTGVVRAAPYGACCDDLNEVCTDCVQGDCLPPLRFSPNTTCEDLDPACGQVTGACCLADGSCVELTPRQCADAGGEYKGHFTTCPANPCLLCGLVCPAGASQEGEPVCYDDYDDQFNGGCNTEPTPVFSDIACGDTVCGTAGTFLFGVDNFRDTDWYKLTLAAETQITWTVQADLPVLAGIVNNFGIDSCTGVTAFLSSATGDECDIVSVTACLAPGTWYLFVAPSAFTGVPCGSDYTATVTCANCPQGACCIGDGTCQLTSQPGCPGNWAGADTTCTPELCPPNDLCDAAEALAIGDSVIVDNSNAADDPQSTATCGTGSVNQAVWYTVVGNGETLTATTCNAGGNFYDTKLQVWCNECDNLVCAGGDDDSPCVISNLRSTVTWCSEVGRTYYIAVGGYAANEGVIELSVTADGTACSPAVNCIPPTGACCLGTTCAATNLLPECNTLGGVWYIDQDCATFNCPVPISEDCDDAFVIPSIPYAAQFNNNLATADGPEGTCDYFYPTTSGLMQNDHWFEWTAPYDCTASTSAVGTYDAIVVVRNNCTDLNEIGCSDDFASGTPEVVIWDAVGGVTYFIQVGDVGNAEGGGLTDFTLECSAGTGACCFTNGDCQELSLGDCATAGGIFSGDGTDCDPNPCPQPPPNDDCENAAALSVPGNVIVDIDLATDDPESTATCGTGSLNQAVWYEVVGTGNTLTASTCNPGGDFNDTKLQVWCNNCTAPICVGGDDDDPACAISTVRSTVTWCSEAGVTYLIAIGGFSTNEGVIELSVTEGAACGTPPSCTPPPPGGETCANPLVVDIPADLAFSQSNTTCFRVNDYSTTCMGLYDDGEDILYRLDVTADTCTRISVQGSSTKVGVGLDDTCPLGGTGACLAMAITTANPDVISPYLLTAGTYYLMIDTYPSPTCADFTLNITDLGLPACAPTYCTSNATSTADSLCQAVAMNTLNNVSGTACVAYSDFTAMSTTLTQGQSYNLDVTTGTCAGCYSKWTKAFVDWNQDLDFADAGEQVFTSGSTSPLTCPQTVSGMVTVPGGAALGSTRMRVVVREGGTETSTVACGTYTWGETEDYTVNIVAPAPPLPDLNEPWDDDDADDVPNFCDNCPEDANTGQEDSDGDGNGDACDICPGFDDSADADGDTVPDGCDVCPGFDDLADADGDTVPDGCDNCPDDANTDQANNDADSLGNVCDNCPNVTNQNQSDVDADGVGDVCDNCMTDPNGPDLGTCILGSPGPFDEGVFGGTCLIGADCPAGAICDRAQRDTDGDGTGNACDDCPGDGGKVEPGVCGCGIPDEGDADGDGFLDCVDQCPGADDAVFAPECVGAIPTVSQWGLLVLALLLLVGGKLYFGRRAATA